MKLKNLLVLPILSLLCFSCSSNESACIDSSETTPDYAQSFYPCNSEKLRGSIHKISGEGDYFKYNGALFEVLILNKGISFGGTTRIYINGTYTDHKTITDATFKEGQECFGILQIGTMDAKNKEDANWITFKTPYLSYLYIEEAK